MRTTTITVTHHGRTIHGQSFLPEKPGKYPVVLFSHGFNGSMNNSDYSAAHLCRNGIAAVNYTFCGGSDKDKSGFPTTEMSVLTEKEDLLAMLAWVQQQPEFDAGNIFLFGGSMGGLVTILAAEDCQQDVQGLVLLFPALCIPDDWRMRFPNEEDIPDTHVFWNFLLGRTHFEAIRHMDPFSYMPGIDLPVMILHGDKDPIVNVSYSQRAEKAFPHAELTIFPGEAHGFTAEANRKMDAMITDFVKKHTFG